MTWDDFLNSYRPGVNRGPRSIKIEPQGKKKMKTYRAGRQCERIKPDGTRCTTPLAPDNPGPTCSPCWEAIQEEQTAQNFMYIQQGMSEAEVHERLLAVFPSLREAARCADVGESTLHTFKHAKKGMSNTTLHRLNEAIARRLREEEMAS